MDSSVAVAMADGLTEASTSTREPRLDRPHGYVESGGRLLVVEARPRDQLDHIALAVREPGHGTQHSRHALLAVEPAGHVLGGIRLGCCVAPGEARKCPGQPAAGALTVAADVAGDAVQPGQN